MFVFTLACGNAAADRTELVTVGPGGANVTYGTFVATSKDGTKVLFYTGDALVPEDADGNNCFAGYDFYGRPLYGACTDYYLRDLDAGTTTLVSTGPLGGTGTFNVEPDAAISADGSRVVFATGERLTSGDMDTSADVYVRDVPAGTTTLVSVGPIGGQNAFDALNPRITPDGSRIIFHTTERLTLDDTDSSRDGYLRFNGNTILVTTGPVAGNSDGGARYPDTLNAFAGNISPDGKRALFGSRQQQTADDTDDCSQAIVPGPCTDLYERDISAGSTQLVTTGPTSPNGAYGVQFGGVTSDLTHVYFSTAEPLTADDTDTGCPFHDGLGEVQCLDVFERAGGETRLISTGPRNTNSTADAFFVGVTPDASHVFFRTEEQLVDADTDANADIYDRAGNTTTLISGSATIPPESFGSGFVGSSPDGSRVVFITADRLVPADTDSKFDFYARHSDGSFELLSTGPVGGNGPYHAAPGVASEDATRLFFITAEQLVAEDTDQREDIYQRFNGQTSLVSKGSTGADAGRVSIPFAPVGDGRRLFFYADGPLEPQDTDNASDLYVSIASEPPRCDTVEPDRALLWPPNGRFRTITLAGATDPAGNAVPIEITGVTQDEPVGGQPDARRSSGEAVRLRAERDSRDNGRVYRVAFRATDPDGASCEGAVTVAVPRKKKQPAVDSAPPSYDSFGY
jgi:hypothetical protein